MASTRSSPVRTAKTPGCARAAATSIRTIRACPYGLPRNAAWAMPSGARSATNAPFPVRRRSSSIRGGLAPTSFVIVALPPSPPRPPTCDGCATLHPADCPPHLLRSEGHVDVLHAERCERVDDRVDVGLGRGDCPGLPDPLDPDRVVRGRRHGRVRLDVRRLHRARDQILEEVRPEEAPLLFLFSGLH